MGLACFFAGTAKQAAGPQWQKPAADELKILPQIRSILQPCPENIFLTPLAKMDNIRHSAIF
jgi:hypothetical protein